MSKPGRREREAQRSLPPGKYPFKIHHVWGETDLGFHADVEITGGFHCGLRFTCYIHNPSRKRGQ